MYGTLYKFKPVHAKKGHIKYAKRDITHILLTNKLKKDPR